MARQDTQNCDSLWQSGGKIPGLAAPCAFSFRCPDASPIPILLAVPHAGRAYPRSLLERLRHPGFAALRLEDRYVDLLAEEVARQTGASLLVARAPRAMIDLNRAADDIDWDMVDRDAPPGDDSYTPGRRARSGLGLIPRRLPGIGELWKRRHGADELAARIAGIHEPYHAQLADALAAMRDRWGAALLIDLHSMPPLTGRCGQGAPEFVVGDRFGATCDGALVGSAFKYFSDLRRGSAHNRPYAGGYVLERHAAPRRGVHALQLEIDRSCYLDSRLSEPGRGFPAMIHLLVGLVRQLSADVAALGQIDTAAGWRDAAE